LGTVKLINPAAQKQAGGCATRGIETGKGKLLENLRDVNAKT